MNGPEALVTFRDNLAPRHRREGTDWANPGDDANEAMRQRNV